MKLIYLTNSMLEEDFDDLNRDADEKANPSNQNFHRRLIRALTLNHQVIAVSYRPIPTYGKPAFIPYSWKRTRRVTYHYLAIHNRRYVRQKHIIDDGYKLIGKIMKAPKTEAPLLIVDALNGTLRKLAIKCAKKFSLKTVAIITDNPLLLSGAARKPALAAIKEMRSFNYFIPLTPSLDILVNPEHRPHLNLPGIVESRSKYPDYSRPYIFFCGALHERYGINNLVEAFLATSYDVDLLVAGHGPDHFLKTMEEKDPRVKFLGQLTQEDIYKYEAGALLNINPRPYDRTLNEFSIPSKFFEYMTSGAPTLSTEHELLTPKYQKLAIWAGTGTPTELKNALIQFMAMSAASRDKMARKAKETILAELGIEPVGTLLDQFIKSLR